MSNSALPGRPVLLLGLDGLGQELIDAPLMREAAPNLLALLRDGRVAPLRSTFPPYTAPAWTSITTGVDPGQHGVFGFTDADGHAVSDASVAVPRLWDYVGRAGGRSVVINMPITYPARPIEGVLISGMPVPPNAPFTAPAELGHGLADGGYVVDIGVRDGGRDDTTTLERLRAMTEARGRAAARLARDEPWDLFVVVFVLPDRLGHPWWKQLVPGDPQYDSREGERTRKLALAALQALDRAVTDLMAALPERTAVVTCSDHGFGSHRADVFFDVTLARAGLLTEPRAPGLRRALATIGRVPIARRLPRQLRSLGARAAGAPQPVTTRQDRAWTATPYECGVRLSRDAEPGLAEQVIALLEGLSDPDGRAVVARVTRREDCYLGPSVDRAADLLVEFADEGIDLHDGMHASSHWVSRERVPWGTHRRDGIVAVSDPAVRQPATAPDVAGTVLDLLGIKATHEVVAHDPGAVYSDDEEAAVMAHLRSLGYVD